jgi:DNA-binding PadR family transcriptional regulator
MPSDDPDPRDPLVLLPLSPPAFHVLAALGERDLHGWAILKEVASATGGRLRLSSGTLYPLVKRLLRDGLIAESSERPPAHWDDERRRYYALTPFGRRVALAEAERMRRAVTVAGARLAEPREV